jgi:hypothetical protein
MMKVFNCSIESVVFVYEVRSGTELAKLFMAREQIV